MKVRNLTKKLIAFLSLLLVSVQADAGTLLFSTTVDPPGSNVDGATVSAEFSEVSGGQFTLTLTYISADVAGKFDNVAVMTGFVWQADSSAKIEAESAVVATGSQLVKLDKPSKSAVPYSPQFTDVSPYWGFDPDLVGAGTAGGGGSGLPDGTFGSHNLIGDGGSPGGVDYGLVPVLAPGDDYWVTQSPVIESSLVLTFTVTEGTFNPLTDVTSGSFLFGSELNVRSAGGPIIDDTTVVPEPSSLALLGMGLATVAGGRWRKRRRGTNPQD
ncbi:PEP-CTERM motif protein [Maioricimonas rarisocia]|uniref:PEP-CTERM motif protein n=1 Tax=Maioricimonas rarisocia TaxID=2528026 RepID=A0A517Z3X0_9PLAN|nr:PEP-CTERM sorting domain-containing protein [Maioricimonas rarisocia]QDU37190.1 PEP-CTERM motif protein [Maioricimonas rarisocia]